MAGKRWAQRQREITREMGALAYDVCRQPWRPWKNRQRRAQIRRLLAESEALDAARERRVAEFRAAAQRRP